MTLRCLSLNRSTLLVELADLDAVLALHDSVQREAIEGVKEILPAARTLMVVFDPETLSRAALVESLATRELVRGQRLPGPQIDIPLRYDGEDLAEVARLAGLGVDEVIHRHGQSEFTVAFCGFSPGFAYLVGGDPALQVPRRATPRARVPAGAVALGGGYCGVYPQASPGGWQIIGTTPLAMWEPTRDPPALLTPGVRVRFRDISIPAANVASTPHASSGAGAPMHHESNNVCGSQLEVTAAMLPVLLQDLGRPGHAAMGVSASGAMDRAALQAANRAVDNPAGLAGLEITFGSFAFRCSGAMDIALAGAPAPIRVQRACGEIFDGVLGQPIALGVGDSVKLGYPPRGVRTYLAVAGGFRASKILGSASRDTLAGLGPAPIVKGTTLSVNEKDSRSVAASRARAPDEVLALADATDKILPASGDELVLEAFVGPRADWFTRESREWLSTQVWQVTPQSSRVGLRLRGERPLLRCTTAELPSEGITRGALQVPHDGQPVLLLADHPVTGGYPVIAVLAEHHLDLAGQLPPGCRIRFRLIDESAT